MFRKLLTLLFCSAVLCTPWTAHSADKLAEVRIAVLFTEDPLFFINTFAPTLDHLRKALPQYKIVTKSPGSIADGSAAVTGLLLALTLPATAPYWLAAVGGVFAIVVVKGLSGGLGQNIFNPALAARAFLMLL
mgnify:CR=1 FL=1